MAPILANPGRDDGDVNWSLPKLFVYGLVATLLGTWSLYFFRQISHHLAGPDVYAVVESAWFLFTIPAELIRALTRVPIYNPDSHAVSGVGIALISVTNGLIGASGVVLLTLPFLRSINGKRSPPSPPHFAGRLRILRESDVAASALLGFVILATATGSVYFIIRQNTGDNLIGWIAALSWRVLSILGERVAVLFGWKFPGFFSDYPAGAIAYLVCFNGILGALLFAFALYCRNAASRRH